MVVVAMFAITKVEAQEPIYPEWKAALAPFIISPSSSFSIAYLLRISIDFLI